MRLRVTTLLVLLIAGTSNLGGQAIRCPAGRQKDAASDCIMKRNGLVEQIPIVVEGIDKKPLAGATVRFKDLQVGTIDTAIETDPQGAVTATWRGPATLKDEDVKFKVEATSGSGNLGFAPLNVVLKKVPSGPLPPDSIAIVGGSGQAWYAGRQLPERIRIKFFGPATVEACSAAVVAFKPMGGSEVVPDSARGRLHDGSCEAEAYWKLSGTVGEQMARAWIANAKPMDAKAYSRKEPWLAAGLAVTWTSKYDHLAVSSQNIQVVTKSATAETTFTVPRQSGKLETLGGRVGFTPTLGINTPIFTRWHHVRASISADAQHLTTDWFAGLSLPQLLRSIWSEDMGVDFHLLAHVSRRDEVTNAGACASNVATCVKDTRTGLVGGGVALQLNASSALAAIAGLFPK